MNRYFWHLSNEQADGVACVVCAANFLSERIESVVVGLNPADESKVSACKDPCAVVIAHEAEQMAEEMRLASGTVNGSASDTYGIRPMVGTNSEFGSLLRDLRVLTGTDALLTTMDDIPAIKFLLGVVITHAEDAGSRARRVLEWMEGGE